MFTGVVKLAQVDDYISPSQNCIQPKIMKQAKQPQKATVSLNDCLACSGCITSAQSVLIEQMSVSKLQSLINENPTKIVIFILAPQVILAISNKFQIQFIHAFQIISDFLKRQLRAQLVLDLWQGTKIAHELQYQQYMNKDKKTILCSQCPGWICYAQKTLTEEIVSLISKIKSPQQILARKIKQQYPQSYVITVMPCYDKKLQAIRFQIQNSIKQVDITITTTQLLTMYNHITKEQLQNIHRISKTQNFIVDRFLFKSHPLQIFQDQTSNSHLESLLKRLNATNVSRNIVKNTDFVQITAQINGQLIKMAKCYGFRNIQKIVQLIKKRKCQYSYVQIMACPGGCFSGGGQPKIQNIKAKQITEKFMIKGKPYVMQTNINIQLLEQKNIQIYKANYKVIEQSLTQAVMNW